MPTLTVRVSSEENALANLHWGMTFGKILERSGMKKIFFSPGSRSTPLIVGVERNSNIELIPVLDERTAAFLALGTSKRDGLPTGLICTSGSALTHWFPAVTEASHSSIPLLLFSADRPPELQNCGAEQTIDQRNLFGNFVRSFHQMEAPRNNSESMVKLSETLGIAFQEAMSPNPGPVHLNFPFREPFLPKNKIKKQSLVKIDFPEKTQQSTQGSLQEICEILAKSKRPLVVAGSFVSARQTQGFLKETKVPIICDSLSPIRNSPIETAILRYENLLRDPEFALQATPDLVITLGPLPTSKTLRKWIDDTGAERIIIEPRGVKVDPLSSKSSAFQVSYDQIAKIQLPQPDLEWFRIWKSAELQVDKKLDQSLAEHESLFEGKLTRLLSLHLPENSQVMYANSMPIRDLEWFWKQTPRSCNLFGNRGVNGIDGTLGTALGIAHDSQKTTFLVSGDLAFLHDSNALLFAPQFRGSLTVFVINNNGGGIFENLPIASEPEFEKCFATPQHFQLSKLCESFEVQYEFLKDWEPIADRIKFPDATGIRVVEIKTDRKKDRETRARLLALGPDCHA